MNIETWTDPHGLKAEYEQYQRETWDQQRACMNYPEWLEYRFDALVQASDALIDEKDDEIYQMRNLLLWAQNVINDRGFLTSDQQRLVNEIKDVLTETDETPPNEDGHVGFYATTDDGTPFHVLGDPNMSDETLKALGELAKAAMKAVDEGTLPDFDEDEGEIVHDMPDWYVGFGMQDEPSPAPPDSYIALSDAEIAAAEEEDREFQMCHTCGQLHEDCQCEDD